MISVQRAVAASPRVVWSLWEDVEGSPRWDRDVAWSRLGGPFMPGTRGEFVLTSGLRVGFELTALEPLRSYENRAWLLPGVRVLFGHSLAPLDGTHTLVTHSARFEGWLGRLLAPLLGPKLEVALQRALRALGSLAERSA